MTISKVEATDISFDELKEGSELYIQRRNRRLLNNHRKELRVLTKAEAVAYLDIDARTCEINFTPTVSKRNMSALSFLLR